MYEVSEDARLDTEFRRSVKGTSQFGDALVRITAAADGTASRYYVLSLQAAVIFRDCYQLLWPGMGLSFKCLLSMM